MDNSDRAALTLAIDKLASLPQDGDFVSSSSPCITSPVVTVPFSRPSESPLLEVPSPSSFKHNAQLSDEFLKSIGNEATFLPTGLGMNDLLNDVIRTFLRTHPSQHVVVVVVRPAHALDLAKRLREAVGVPVASFCGGDFLYDFEADFEANRVLVITAGLLMRLTKLGTYKLQRASLMILHDAFCVVRNHPMNTLVREYYWKSLEPSRGGASDEAHEDRGKLQMDRNGTDRVQVAPGTSAQTSVAGRISERQSPGKERPKSAADKNAQQNGASRHTNSKSSVYRPKILSIIHPQLRLADRPFDKLRQLVRKLCHGTRAGILLPTGPYLEELAASLHTMHIAMHGYEFKDDERAVLDALQMHCVLVWDTLHKFGQNHFGRLIHVSPALVASDGSAGAYRSKTPSLPGMKTSNEVASIAMTNNSSNNTRPEEAEAPKPRPALPSLHRASTTDRRSNEAEVGTQVDASQASDKTSESDSIFHGPKSSESPFYGSTGTTPTPASSVANKSNDAGPSLQAAPPPDAALAAEPIHHNWEAIELMVHHSILLSEQLPDWNASLASNESNGVEHFRNETALVIMRHVLSCCRAMKRGLELGLSHCLRDLVTALDSLRSSLFAEVEPSSMPESERGLRSEVVRALSVSPLVTWLASCEEESFVESLACESSRGRALKEIMHAIADHANARAAEGDASPLSIHEDLEDGDAETNHPACETKPASKDRVVVVVVVVVVYDEYSAKVVGTWLGQEDSALAGGDVRRWRRPCSEPGDGSCDGGESDGQKYRTSGHPDSFTDEEKASADTSSPSSQQFRLCIDIMTSREAASAEGHSALCEAGEVVWFSAVDVMHLAGSEYDSRAFDVLCRVCALGSDPTGGRERHQDGDDGRTAHARVGPECHIVATGAQASAFLELRRADQLLLSAMQLVQGGDASLEEYLADLAVKTFDDGTHNTSTSEWGTPSPASVLHTLCLGLSGIPPLFKVDRVQGSTLPNMMDGGKEAFQAFVLLPKALVLTPSEHGDEVRETTPMQMRGSAAELRRHRGLEESIYHYHQLLGILEPPSLYGTFEQRFVGSVSLSEAEARDAAAEKALSSLVRSGVVAAYWPSRRQISVAQQILQQEYAEEQRQQQSRRGQIKAESLSHTAAVENASSTALLLAGAHDNATLSGSHVGASLPMTPPRSLGDNVSFSPSPRHEGHWTPDDAGLPPSPFIDGAVSLRGASRKAFTFESPFSQQKSPRSIQTSIQRQVVPEEASMDGTSLEQDGGVDRKLEGNSKQDRKADTKGPAAVEDASRHLCTVCGIMATSAEHLAEHYRGKRHHINVERLEKQAEATAKSAKLNQDDTGVQVQGVDESQKDAKEALDGAHEDALSCGDGPRGSGCSLDGGRHGTPLGRSTTFDRLPSTLSDTFVRRSSSINLLRPSSGSVYDGFPCIRVGETVLPSSMDFRAFIEEMQQAGDFLAESSIVENVIKEDDEGCSTDGVEGMHIDFSFGTEAAASKSGHRQKKGSEGDGGGFHGAERSSDRWDKLGDHGSNTTGAKERSTRGHRTFSTHGHAAPLSPQHRRTPPPASHYGGIDGVDAAVHPPLQPFIPSQSTVSKPMVSSGPYFVGDHGAVYHPSGFLHYSPQPLPQQQVGRSVQRMMPYVAVPMMYNSVPIQNIGLLHNASMPQHLIPSVSTPQYWQQPHIGGEATVVAHRPSSAGKHGGRDAGKSGSEGG